MMKNLARTISPSPLVILFGLLALLIFLNSAIAQQNNQSSCKNIQVQVLGSGGPEIYDGLASSSYLVWINNKARILIDAGGGSSLNFEKSGADFNNLQAILLSHLHVDHSAALPVYIKGGFFTGREQNLPLFGPDTGGVFPSTINFTKALFSDQQNSAYKYLADFIEKKPSSLFLLKAHNVSPKNRIWSKTLNAQITLSAINVNHGAIPALAWRVDSGQCSVTFSGDMNGSSGNLPKLAKNTDVLIAHNAIPEGAGKIPKYLHMTATTIGKLAKASKIHKLVLSHFMYKTAGIKDVSSLAIAKNYSGQIVLAKDLMKISLNR
jgi:ribonuclease BN (tRNA processing enzyme)